MTKLIQTIICCKYIFTYIMFTLNHINFEYVTINITLFECLNPSATIGHKDQEVFFSSRIEKS